MRHLISAMNRESFVVSFDQLRQKVSLAHSPDSKRKYCSLSGDEAFMLGAHLMSISKNQFSKHFAERMKGVLGGNFWKVINHALANPPREPLPDDFSTPYRKEIKDLQDRLNKAHDENRRTQSELSQAVEKSKQNYEKLVKALAENEKLRNPKLFEQPDPDTVCRPNDPCEVSDCVICKGIE